MCCMLEGKTHREQLSGKVDTTSQSLASTASIIPVPQQHHRTAHDSSCQREVLTYLPHCLVREWSVVPHGVRIVNSSLWISLHVPISKCLSVDADLDVPSHFLPIQIINEPL